MSEIIHLDQSGFIKGRQTHDNIRRTLHLVEKVSRFRIPVVLVGLDAEKAFDRVDWQFLLLTLKRFGFGDRFIQIIRANYVSPSSRVQVNGISSNTFRLARGTPLRCPLSPLLFALSSEPLAAQLRASQDIQGIRFREDKHKVSLYAGNVLFTLTSPRNSLRALQGELQRFEAAAGFRVNLTKSTVLNLTVTEGERLLIQGESPFAWAKCKITYLGIQITPRLEELFKANFPPLVSQIQNELRRWKPLFISWLGRINAVKMTVLPKLLYLFQALPKELEKDFLPGIRSMILQYIWQNGRARLPFQVLRKPRSEGGAALPDFGLYYKASQLRVISEWSNRESDKDWLHMDRAIVGRTIWDVLWKPKKDRPPNAYLSTPLEPLSGYGTR